MAPDPKGSNLSQLEPSGLCLGLSGAPGALLSQWRLRIRPETAFPPQWRRQSGGHRRQTALSGGGRRRPCKAREVRYVAARAVPGLDAPLPKGPVATRKMFQGAWRLQGAKHQHLGSSGRLCAPGELE